MKMKMSFKFSEYKKTLFVLMRIQKDLKYTLMSPKQAKLADNFYWEKSHKTFEHLQQVNSVFCDKEKLNECTVVYLRYNSLEYKGKYFVLLCNVNFWIWFERNDIVVFMYGHYPFDERKVKSSYTSRLEAHFTGFFTLLMKRIFDPYVLWPFDKSWFPN